MSQYNQKVEALSQSSVYLILLYFSSWQPTQSETANRAYFLNGANVEYLIDYVCVLKAVILSSKSANELVSTS